MSRKWSKSSLQKISREHQWPHHGMKTSLRCNMTVPLLEKEQAKLFHTVTTQGLFLCKHGCLDISPAIAYLTTQVQKPNHTDWSKLCRILHFLKQTVKDKITLRADSSGHLKWHCNTAFALYDDFRSHADSTS